MGRKKRLHAPVCCIQYAVRGGQVSLPCMGSAHIMTTALSLLYLSWSCFPRTLSTYVPT